LNKFEIEKRHIALNPMAFFVTVTNVFSAQRMEYENNPEEEQDSGDLHIWTDFGENCRF
jgi:hypothetical protein